MPLKSKNMRPFDGLCRKWIYAVYSNPYLHYKKKCGVENKKVLSLSQTKNC